jgi:CDP-glycerol glycerophosphotransferase (TagB/SpsB family)
LAEKFSHIKLLGPDVYNITPYYKISDILLTEASSTIYEMIALEKPVIVNRFYRLKLSHRLFRYRLFKKRLNKEMNKDIANFCFEMNRAKDLPQVLDTAFNENHKRLNIVREYQTKMLYKLDGKASERVRDSILNHFKN